MLPSKVAKIKSFLLMVLHLHPLKPLPARRQRKTINKWGNNRVGFDFGVTIGSGLTFGLTLSKCPKVKPDPKSPPV